MYDGSVFDKLIRVTRRTGMPCRTVSFRPCYLRASRRSFGEWPSGSVDGLAGSDPWLMVPNSRGTCSCHQHSLQPRTGRYRRTPMLLRALIADCISVLVKVDCLFCQGFRFLLTPVVDLPADLLDSLSVSLSVSLSLPPPSLSFLPFLHLSLARSLPLFSSLSPPLPSFPPSLPLSFPPSLSLSLPPFLSFPPSSLHPSPSFPLSRVLSLSSLLSFKGQQSTCRLFWRLSLSLFRPVPSPPSLPLSSHSSLLPSLWFIHMYDKTSRQLAMYVYWNCFGFVFWTSFRCCCWICLHERGIYWVTNWWNDSAVSRYFLTLSFISR